MSVDVVAIARFAPVAPIARVLSRFDRAQIEAFAEVSIALLDLIDGDADMETEALEDDFTLMPADIDFGPGCPIADAGGQVTEDEISAYRGPSGPHPEIKSKPQRLAPSPPPTSDEKELIDA